MTSRHAPLALAVVLLATPALALPPSQSDTGADDDATLTITVLQEFIQGDSHCFCSLRLVVLGVDVPFSDGDSVEVRVAEDDWIVGDDPIWSASFDVSAEELAANRVERSFDCTAAFGDGWGADVEVYATAHVQKSGCAWYNCLQDDPSTRILDVVAREDDDEEDDDSQQEAPALGLGRTAGRIARDVDWHRAQLPGRAAWNVRVLHNVAAGRVDASLHAENGDQIAGGVEAAAATVIDVAELDPAVYYLRVRHRGNRHNNDFNFYDVQLDVTPLAGDCQADETQREDCGQCGERTRTCGNNGLWLPWGDCDNEGECQPGATRNEACGRCGSRTQTCTAQCAWGAAGDCEDQGECEAGATGQQPCADGEGQQTRTCGPDCTWGDYGDCQTGAGCTDDHVRSCYDGPAGTPGVGVCKTGTQRCSGGEYGACEGQVTPTAEQCDNNKDDDCDGDVDAADDACQGGGEGEGEGGQEPTLGEPCSSDGQCGGELTCLRGPDHAVFWDGYCGTVGCTGACPAGAKCIDAFGARYCLKPCVGSRDCRDGYICALFEGGVQACLPRCTQDADCTDDAKPACNLSNGICVPDGGGGEPDSGTGGGQPVGPGDVGVASPGAALADDSGCECRATPGSRGTTVWLLPLLWLAVRRR